MLRVKRGQGREMMVRFSDSVCLMKNGILLSYIKLVHMHLIMSNGWVQVLVAISKNY